MLLKEATFSKYSQGSAYCPYSSHLDLLLNCFSVVLPSITMRQIDEVQRLLAKSIGMVKSFMYGSHKRTLLHKAAETGDLTICKLLINKGANVNKEDTRKKTPLWCAAEKGHKDVCNVLIQKGAFVDKTDTTWKTPLWIAASKRHQDVCEILIANGASVKRFDAFNIKIMDLVDDDMGKQFLKWNIEYGKWFNLFTLFLNQLKSSNDPMKVWYGFLTSEFLRI